MGMAMQDVQFTSDDGQALHGSDKIERSPGYDVVAGADLHQHGHCRAIDDHILDLSDLDTPHGPSASFATCDVFVQHDHSRSGPQFARTSSQTNVRPADGPSRCLLFQQASRDHNYVSAANMSTVTGSVLTQSRPSPSYMAGSAAEMYDFTWQSTPVSSTYPVLEPLLPYIRSFLTGHEADCLLELYFSSSFSIHMHPVCNHVHAYVFRRSSILHPTKPRPCSPALLASMLCAAAQTEKAGVLSWSHTRRRRISRKLFLLSIQLLRPLVHFNIGCARAGGDKGDSVSAGRPACRLGSNKSGDHLDACWDALPLAETEGSLDDVVAYINVATITSASEHKAASMRWWHAAFTLSKESQLNREVVGDLTEHDPSCPRRVGYSQGRLDAETDTWTGSENYGVEPGLFTSKENIFTAANRGCSDRCDSEKIEEMREEQRRVWWLLYIMDRHLALCYNRPLSLLDAECEGLLLPLNEVSWQSSYLEGGWKELLPKPRVGFPTFECTDHNIYGFFLPLMTIVGEIIDLNHARNHPLLDLTCQGSKSKGRIEAQISQQSSIYENSLPVFEAAHGGLDDWLLPEPSQESLHTKVVIAYATHMTHVVRILLAGKWDPVSLFNDRDSGCLRNRKFHARS